MKTFTHIRHRISTVVWDFVHSLKHNPFDEYAHGVGVEIGVWRAAHAVKLLANPAVRMLYLVDPYAPYNEPVKSEFMRQAKATAILRTRRDINRRTFITEPSLEAAGRFENKSLDFVYLDGDHAHDAVLADLKAWWPKLKAGAFLGLDDYKSRIEALKGVTTAAEAFGQRVSDLGGVGLIIKPI